MKIDDLYGLYVKCFPNYLCIKDTFETFLKPQQAAIYTEYNKDKLIAYTIVWGNSISLLCVNPEYQNKGIGTKLLYKAESHIQKNNPSKILLGRGSHYLLQGVPESNVKAVQFFKKFGYTASWTSVNMKLDLKIFNYNMLKIPVPSSNISFRYAEPSDMNALLTSVDNTQPEWHNIFTTCIDPVLLAIESDTNCILGFEILSFNGGRFIKNAGCIGCVGVITSARNKGIGRQMVAKGAEIFKSHGLKSIELRYVYLVDWYKALGFEITDSQWMGEKLIK
ncbi:MAG: GNAT family N-acetyltransferase [Clostridiaceae bacterium]|nr:GNAT family N-acetyltransferase [Clostridiaceae bacterium]